MITAATPVEDVAVVALLISTEVTLTKRVCELDAAVAVVIAEPATSISV